MGVATSKTGGISGPYVDSGAPLIRDSSAAAYGMIDPTFFSAGGINYVIFKRDGNAVGKPTPIHIAELTANGTALASSADWSTTQLITNDLPFEGGIVEAPWVVFQANTYFLFYSANGCVRANYKCAVVSAVIQFSSCVAGGLFRSWSVFVP